MTQEQNDDGEKEGEEMAQVTRTRTKETSETAAGNSLSDTKWLKKTLSSLERGKWKILTRLNIQEETLRERQKNKPAICKRCTENSERQQWLIPEKKMLLGRKHSTAHHGCCESGGTNAILTTDPREARTSSWGRRPRKRLCGYGGPTLPLPLCEVHSDNTSRLKKKT